MAISIVEQRPLRGAKVGLLAYHVDAPDGVSKRRLSPRHLLVEKAGKRHLWSTRLCCEDADRSLSSEAQTRVVFDELIHTLAQQGASLRDHCLRTWIFMKDVDIFYSGMVDARRTLFVNQGLTGSTHFIASTGIEGGGAHRYDVMAMDAYSNLDVEPRQISYLNDFDRLCATRTTTSPSSGRRASPIPTARISSSPAPRASTRLARSFTAATPGVSLIARWRTSRRYCAPDRPRWPT